MFFKKISRKRVIILAVLAFFAVLLGYLWRDLHLSGNIGDIKLPDVVVENISIDRLVNGRQWVLKSPRVEHRDGVIYGDSLDISISEDNGKVTKIKAAKGTFTNEKNDIAMTSADAVMADRKKTYRLLAGELKNEADKEIWYFSSGVTLTDEKIKIEGTNGEYETKSGNCRLTNGGKVTWNE